jgi:hypothetical protein
MNESKIAAQSAREELAKMPPSMQKMGQAFLDNKITQKEWMTSLRGLPVETANLGRQFATTAKHAAGFSDLLKGGSGVAQTYQGALSKMTGGMTGLQVALHLTGDHMGTFKANVDTIGKATSETGGHVRGWADTQKGFNVQMGIATESAKNMGIEFGTALLPALTTVMKGFTGFASGLRSGNAGAIAIAATIAILGGLLAAAYTKQVLFAEGSTLLKAATWVATAAQWAYNAALDANPIGIIVLAIAALVAGLIWFFTQTKLGQEIWKNFTQFLSDAWTNTTNLITTVWNAVVKWFQDAIGTVVKFVQEHWGLLLSFIIGPIGLAIQWIVENWGGIVKFFQDVIGRVGAVMGGIGDTIRGAFNGAANFVIDVLNNVSGAINKVIDGINTALDGVKTLSGGAISLHIGHLPILPHLATGGTMTRAGMALVGENGPEIVKLPAGATVYPHGGVPANQSGGGLHIENFYATPEQSPREISQELGWMQRWAT